MKLNIGETIKRMRKEKEITQEEFSQVLGVSCQSVSRWENGSCYPDIELVPTIASFFGVSTDKLMGVDEITEMENVEKYLERFQLSISRGEIDECIAVAREGVGEYPNNYILLDKLMYALFVAGDDDGNIPEWKENMERYDSEITALGERIMKYCPDQSIRLAATARLAFNHCLHGRKEIGRKIYETLPSMENCRELQIWWALKKEEKLSFLRNAIMKSYESLRTFIWLLADADVVDNETELIVLKKVFELEKLILDGNRPNNNWGTTWLNFDIAKRYALLKDYDNMYKHLHLAVDEAKAFDNRPDEQRYSAVLVGEIIERKTDFETADTRTLCEILRDKWMIHDEFDSVRDTDKQEILPIADKFERMGFEIYATSGTQSVLNRNMIAANLVRKISDGEPNAVTLLESGKIHYVISTSAKGRLPERDSVKMRRKSIERSICSLTAIDTAKALAKVLESGRTISDVELVDITKI